MTEDEAIGAAIRHRREALHLPQNWVAEQVALSPVVYGRIEMGTRPIRATEIREVARVLGVTADELLRDGVPATVAELMELAVTRRAAAVGALTEFAGAVSAAGAAGADLHDLTAAGAGTAVRVPPALVGAVSGAVSELVASIVVEATGI